MSQREATVNDEWYWCLIHARVEPAEGCANIDRLGPYPTEEEAAAALEQARERTEEMDRADAADDDWGD